MGDGAVARHYDPAAGDLARLEVAGAQMLVDAR
jgi:hypothetical protein